MQRLLVAAACVVACATFGVASAKATWTMSLAATPATFNAGDTTTFSGTLGTKMDVTLEGHHIVFWKYDNATCSGESVGAVDDSDAPVRTDAKGNYIATETEDVPGVYSYVAEPWIGGFAFERSNCITVTVTAVPPPSLVIREAPSDSTQTDSTQSDATQPETTPEPQVPASSFLCWNHEMTDPVAYLGPVAHAMWATGRYSRPVALAGNVAGGTNVGAYHLVCNAAATLQPTGQGVGGSGEVYSAATTAQYELDGDLGVYRIYR